MTEPKRPADLLGPLMREVRTAAARAPTARALADVLGVLAPHCRVASERGGRLLIDVDSAPVFAELQAFRREELRLAVNAKLDGRKFAEVRFRMQGS